MTTKKVELTYLGKEPVTSEAFTFKFSREGQGFDYLPGQYLRLSLAIDTPDDRGSSRFFTISSSPTEKEVAITTRVIQSSFKMKLRDMNPGDKVSAFGPLGSLFIEENSQESIVMLAGGIGITPFRSILKFANDKGLQGKLVLIVSFSTKAEVIFYDELKEIENNNPNIKVVYTLTKDEVPGFEQGRIDQQMIEKYSSQLDKPKFFIVGPPSMADAMIETVKNSNIDEERIVTESFTGY